MYKLGLEVVILGVSNPIWFWFRARLVLVLKIESSYFFQNSWHHLGISGLFFVFFSLDRTPIEKCHDPLTTRCPVRCSLQSLQGERESRIGERKPGWFWDNLKIIFKRTKFNFFFLERQTIYGGK